MRRLLTGSVEIEEVGDIMRIIAMVNQKGGCGKTTSAINTAAAFAELGKRVLLVDFDSQAHATLGLGCDLNNGTKTIYDVLTRRGTPLSSIVTPTGVDRLDLAPCNVLLASAELELIGTPGKELVLGRALQTVRDAYELCVIDCPPSLGILTLNALVTSTDVIVPVQMHYYALEGLRGLLETVRIIHQRFHPYAVENIGVLLTFVEERTTFSRQIQQQMREVFGELVFNTVIHRNIRLAEAPSAGESILTYASQSRGAADYRALAAEILRTSPMAEGSTAGRARRGMQKQLATIFDGVWIPKQRGPSKPAGVSRVTVIEST
jgi:chromosome partitioning protein